MDTVENLEKDVDAALKQHDITQFYVDVNDHINDIDEQIVDALENDD